MDQINKHMSRFLPAYITLAALISYLYPELFSPFYTSTSFLLGLVLFITGLSMSLKDLKIIKKSLFVMSTGIALKWTFTVIVSVILAGAFFSNDPDLLAGLILTGSVPSGTASTMYTFLAGGTTSLVVAMGIIDIFISPVLTPAIMDLAASHTVEISFLELARKMVFIVILPIIAGMVVKYLNRKHVPKIAPYTKLTSSFTILLIVCSVVASVSSQVDIKEGQLLLISMVVFLQVIIPMVGGYKIASVIGIKREHAIAILFEVGLCNSALAAILALEFFGKTAAVPAVFNMIINLSLGAYFSHYFQKADLQVSKETQVN